MDRQTLVLGVVAGSLGDRPAFQDSVQLQAKIVMQPARRMLLNDKDPPFSRRSLADATAGGFRRLLEIAFASIDLERHGKASTRRLGNALRTPAGPLWPRLPFNHPARLAYARRRWDWAPEPSGKSLCRFRFSSWKASSNRRASSSVMSLRARLNISPSSSST